MVPTRSESALSDSADPIPRRRGCAESPTVAHRSGPRYDPPRSLVALAVLVASIGGCGQGDACGELFAARRYEAAAVACEQRFSREGEVEAGWLATRASFELGREEAVLALARRLEGTARESAALELVAGFHQRAARYEPLLAALDRRRALESAAGRHGAAAEAAYQRFYASWERGALRLALESAVQAFDEADRTDDPALRSRMAQGLASALYELGDLEGARRALAGVPGTADGAERLNTEGSMLLDLGQWGPAEAILAEALRLAETAKSTDLRLLRSIRLNLTEAALQRGDLRAAEAHWTAARARVEAGSPAPVSVLYFAARVKLARGDAAGAEADLVSALGQEPGEDWRWYLELERGHALERRGDLVAAATAYQASIAALDGLRAKVRWDDFKSSLAERKLRPYEALFALAAEQGRAGDALAVFEAASARSFLDAFVAAAAREDAPASRDASPRWLEAADRAEALEELLPALAESPVVAPRTVEEILAGLGARRVLGFFASERGTWRLDLRQGRLSLKQLALDRSELWQRVERLLFDPNDLAAAEALGTRLFEGLEVEPSDQPLFVVARGDFARYPVGALRVGGRWLGSLRPVVYAPSYSALLSFARRSPRSELGEAVVLADADGDLPAASREAQAVASTLGVEPLVGPRVNRGALARARSARVLHLATHTGAGLRGPWIGLADERVGASWVLSQRVAPHLVVLASCASAARRDHAPGGSLAEAFLAAGSDLVLATLWSVDDRVAERFVSRFYAEGGAASPVLAFARAQRGLALEGQSPAAWAPFVMLGDPGD